MTGKVMNSNAEYAKNLAKACKENPPLRSMRCRLRTGRNILRSLGLGLTAMPPDVRKGSALPKHAFLTGASPQFRGIAPEEDWAGINGGAKPPPHIRRHSRRNFQIPAMTFLFILVLLIVSSCKRETRQFDHGPTESKNYAVTLS